MRKGILTLTKEKALMGNDLQRISRESTITSMEVAEMVKKKDKEMIHDIRKYVRQFNQNNITSVDLFTGSRCVAELGEGKFPISIFV